jgi:signal transduction histidine kinase
MLRGDELPGPERLPALVATFEHDTAIQTSISVTGEERTLDSDARLTLYRTAQEALTNVRKHARADRVEVRLAYEPHGARLTVEDFGAVDVQPASPDGAGYGLTGMRERAELLGGTLAADRTQAGFRVELWVPA